MVKSQHHIQFLLIDFQMFIQKFTVLPSIQCYQAFIADFLALKHKMSGNQTSKQNVTSFEKPFIYAFMLLPDF